jgi:DNA polymerase III subunit alpha
MKEGIPRIVALEMEELHLEPGADPVYLDAGTFVGRSRNVAREAFELLLRNPGESPIFLVSGGEMLEEKIGHITDSSDLHAELKRLLGPRCLSYTSPAEPPMEHVS